MADSGSKFILNLIDHKLPRIIAISDIYPTYFDLGLCSNNSNPICLDYSRRKLDNLIHSGDISMVSPTGNSLLHCISGKFNSEMKYVPIISGYSNTPLYRYIERRPIVTVIDHEKKNLCSLDCREGHMKKNKLCVFVSGSKKHFLCLSDFAFDLEETWSGLRRKFKKTSISSGFKGQKNIFFIYLFSPSISKKLGLG
jgi:hypothetical protein